MKPLVTKLTSVPRTKLLCCPQCYRLISSDEHRPVLQCHACGATLLRGTLSPSLSTPTASS